MNGKELLNALDSQKAGKLFASLYGSEGIELNRKRYRLLIEELLRGDKFNQGDFPELQGGLRLFSVPGRTELGGNHTDHNRGKVLAASIQLDAVAIAAPRQDKRVFFRSAGHGDVAIDLSNLAIREDEKGNSHALIRGIAAEFAARGVAVGGFTANASNTVLSGSGLSSSATIEVLLAKIFDNLYSDGKRSALELAQIGQKAENIYFGKPCGLMDQTACASGGAVAIDFKDPLDPKVRSINFDLASLRFSLCVIDTKGSHSDLTPDYAAVPKEMKEAAAFFGKQVLREVDEKTLLSRLPDLRKAVSDRAILRSFHFFEENRRVDDMLKALEDLNNLPPEAKAEKEETLGDFFTLVKKSGDSSWELLQNVYSPNNTGEQGLSLALAVTKEFLKGKGACRVHGGGFAGTIQAYIPLDMLEEYRNLIEAIFGKGAVTVLRIRPMGAVELEF